MTKHALLIGINEYGEKSGLSPLRFAERDADELAVVLESRYGFSVDTLLGQAATRLAIEERLEKLGSGDTFVFFFAGHGQEVRGQYCLHPAGSWASGRGSLPFEWLSRHWSRGLGYSKVLSIVDACRNEFNWASRGARGFASSRDIELSMVGDNLVEVLYGCSDGEVSYEEEELGHGVFTSSLLQVLREHEGELDSRLLADKANDVMRAWCAQSHRQQRARRYYEPSEQHRIILRHRPEVVVAGEAASSGSGFSPLVHCPLCGKYNQVENSFRCFGCGAEYLCLSHQDSASFLCVRCEAQRFAAEEREAQKREKERAAAELKKEQERLAREKARQKKEAAELQRLRRQLEQEQAALQQQQQAAQPSPPAPANQALPEPSASVARSGEGPYGKEYRDPDTGMEFVWVPPGSFDMGDTFGDGDGDEKPVHRVRLQGFYLGKYAVTQGEWEQIMGENPSRFKKGPRYPVDSVSWKDVEGFIGKLNRKSGKRYALPSEAQWEYAAGWRADGMKSRFGTGKDSIGADEANFNASKEYKESYSRVGEYRGETVAVDSFSPNGLGLYQMSGNVFEWVQDCWHNSYDGAPTDGSAWEGACSASDRVVRGGSWLGNPGGVRAAFRAGFSPAYARYYLGFRLAFPVHQQ
ncbi:MAG: SUMF1/EgtB/PvdO family nonheme iron enzyme [bacterium]|nr:SUMF1/EgtB/PvdO family nonheme iron enzyme [bacterium]